MRFSASSPLRLLPIYRNPLDCTLTGTWESVAPHSPTVRLSYTVPTGRQAMVYGVVSQLCRVTAATTVGRVFLAIYGASGNFLRLHMRKNAAGDTEHGNVTAESLQAEGSAIDVMTGDSSTGGTVDYIGTAVILEFDAG